VKRVGAAGAACIAVILCACHKNIQNTEAVRAGVMTYLAKRSDLSAMDVSIASVSFRGDEADATVHFQAKNTTGAGTGLDMKYILERSGNQWVVKGRHGGMGAGANPHGDMSGSGLPPGHPAIPPPATATP
jgi:hypothetical protein